MFEIEERDVFGEVIAGALVKIELNGSLTSGLKIRWINAIAKAAARMDDTQFIMDWDAEAKRLLIWTVGTSNQIYEVNGKPHGCQAELNGQPCWHLAAKRLVENYFERIAALDAKPEPEPKWFEIEQVTIHGTTETLFAEVPGTDIDLYDEVNFKFGETVIAGTGIEQAIWQLTSILEPKRDLQEFNSAPYLAPPSDAKTEKVGNIRV